MFKRKAAPAYELRELKCFCGSIPIEKGRFFLQGKGGPFHARHMQRPTRKPTLVKYGGGHGPPLDGVDGYVETPNRGSLAGMMENSVLAGLSGQYPACFGTDHPRRDSPPHCKTALIHFPLYKKRVSKKNVHFLWKMKPGMVTTYRKNAPKPGIL